MTILKRRRIGTRLFGFSVHLNKYYFGYRLTFDVTWQDLQPGGAMWQMYGWRGPKTHL